MELPRNIRTLTGVRGFAALWVVVFHLRNKPFFLSFWTPGEIIKVNTATGEFVSRA